jgi:beta-glucosidase/6-phospho-beta-glucosidase/beta-galactosidase
MSGFWSWRSMVAIQRPFVGETPYTAMNFQPGDEERMRAPLDWIGVNHYNRHIISSDGNQHGPGPDPSYYGLGFNQPMGAGDTGIPSLGICTRRIFLR